MKNTVKSPKPKIGDDVLALDSTKTSTFEKALKTAKSVKAKKEAEAAESATQLKPGIILLEHIPFGFFEDELRGFFGQFGKVLRLRVARSEKTGQSKGYAFIEFEFEDVAKIAAESMDGYLMFERLMKCKVLPSDVNSYKVFGKRHISAKKFPKLKSRELVKSQQRVLKSEDQLKGILRGRVQKVKEQNKKLAELGINYSFKAPELPAEEETEEKQPAVESKKSKKASLSSVSPARLSPKKAKSPKQILKSKSPLSAPKEALKLKSPKASVELIKAKSPKTPKEQPEKMKTPKKSPLASEPVPKSKTPEAKKLPRISPKLLRSRKSLPASAASPAATSKTPKRVKESPIIEEIQTPLSSNTPKSKKKSPKLKMSSPPPEKLPKFSPKLLRSRKSDISSLTVAALSSKKSAQKAFKVTDSPLPDTPKEAKEKQPSPKATKFPKFSPKLLRSRKSDASGLQQKKSPEGRKTARKSKC